MKLFGVVKCLKLITHKVIKSLVLLLIIFLNHVVDVEESEIIDLATFSEFYNTS